MSMLPFGISHLPTPHASATGLDGFGNRKHGAKPKKTNSSVWEAPKKNGSWKARLFLFKFDKLEVRGFLTIPLWMMCLLHTSVYHTHQRSSEIFFGRKPAANICKTTLIRLSAGLIQPWNKGLAPCRFACQPVNYLHGTPFCLFAANLHESALSAQVPWTKQSRSLRRSQLKKLSWPCDFLSN